MSNLVRNKEIVVDYFGYLPTFHDDYILDVSLSTDQVSKAANILLKIEIAEWNNNNQSGMTVTIRFSEVSEMELEGFEPCNIISSIDFKEHSNGVEAVIGSSVGLNGRIVSKEVSIESIMTKPMQR